MNKWFRRAVGTVGIAGGILLLGAGTANADDAALTPGLLDDLFSPTGGPNNLGLALAPDAPATAEQLVLHSLNEDGEPQDAVQMRELLGALPISSVLPTNGLGLPTGNSIPVLSPDQDIATLGTPGAQLVKGALGSNSGGVSEAGGVGGLGLPVDAQTPTVDQIVSGQAPLGGSLLDGGLPVQGNLVPVGGLPPIPLGGSLLPEGGIIPGTEGAEAGGLPLIGTPVLGQLLGSVLQNNPLQGVPIGAPAATGPLDGSLPVSGLPVNGLPVNGLPVNGLPVEGLPLSGLPLSGLPVNGLPVESLPVVGEAFAGYRPRHAAPRHAATPRHAAGTHLTGARHARVEGPSEGPAEHESRTGFGAAETHNGFGTALDANDVDGQKSLPLVGVLPGGGKLPTVAPLGGGQAAGLPIIGNLLSQGAGFNPAGMTGINPAGQIG